MEENELINEELELNEELEYQFENYRTNIVTIMAYLIGVYEDKIVNSNTYDKDTYYSLVQNDNANIIRHLCILRNQIFHNYNYIVSLKQRDIFMQYEKMTQYFNLDSIDFLRKKGIIIFNDHTSKNITLAIAYINQYIADKIEKIKPLFPDWIKFEYIRPLFLMPGCYSGFNGTNIKSKDQQNQMVIKIHKVRQQFLSQMILYPYQTYITWQYPFSETAGNIFFNDWKFLKLLYSSFNDQFRGTHYIVDAKESTKEKIYEFVKEANNISIFVDCENVNPLFFASAILNLNEDNIGKIKNIILYDDENTSIAWDYLENIIDLPIKHEKITRVLENKSLVDIAMTAGVFTEYYENNNESIVLASSDSDFWGIIAKLPKARYFVMNERMKTSNLILEKLDEHNIDHCFINEFAQDKVHNFKTFILEKELLSRIKDFNERGVFTGINIDEFIDDIFVNLGIYGPENQLKIEKDNFYKKYLKNGLILLPEEQDGKMIYRMQLNKK